ncbi:MAG TPA: hypothetical protein VHM20_08085 [Gammaproteobacteria bacterium]|jgi:hypothetical protein|nr:hypothetical protein [Gammaproteobacteria bacterium]
MRSYDDPEIRKSTDLLGDFDLIGSPLLEEEKLEEEKKDADESFPRSPSASDLTEIAMSSDSRETSTYIQEAIKDGKKKIGNYEINPTDLKHFQTISENKKFTQALYGEDGKTEDTKEFREAFFGKVSELFNYETKTEPTLTQRLKKFLKRPNKNGTITMEELLGTKGVELYQQAIQEEYNSREFKTAVFIASTKHYAGKSWKDRLILWIGGPSAAGKSFLRDRIIGHLYSLPEKDLPTKENKEEKEKGNFVVSVDGGVEREVSQVRQLVLQAALLKGYTGISDLEGQTKPEDKNGKSIKLKSTIEKAVLAHDDKDLTLHLAIPDTFTHLQTGKISDYAKMENTQQIFSCVTGGRNHARFKRTVERSGSERAWYQRVFNYLRFKINNRNIGCESKIYLRYFDFGVFCSNRARKAYRISQTTNDRKIIDFNVINDSIYLRRGKDGEKMWVECEPNYQGTDTIRITEKAFEYWTKHIYKDPKIEYLQKKKSNIDLKDWWDQNKENKLFEAEIAATTADEDLEMVKAYVRIFVANMPKEEHLASVKDVLLIKIKSSNSEDIIDALETCETLYLALKPTEQKLINDKIKKYINTPEYSWGQFLSDAFLYLLIAAGVGLIVYYGLPLIGAGAAAFLAIKVSLFIFETTLLPIVTVLTAAFLPVVALIVGEAVVGAYQKLKSFGNFIRNKLVGEPENSQRPRPQKASRYNPRPESSGLSSNASIDLTLKKQNPPTNISELEEKGSAATVADTSSESSKLIPDPVIPSPVGLPQTPSSPILFHPVDSDKQTGKETQQPTETPDNTL